MTGIGTFTALQIADLLTTIVVLYLGGFEANPVVRWVMGVTSPIIGLLLIKCAAVFVATYYIRRGRTLGKINGAYSVLIVWNLTAIALAS